MTHWSSRANRAIFGTCAERLVARLFGMDSNPLNSSRPDLIRNDCEPKLSIEVKSGKFGKGIMVIDQLYYSLTKGLEYQHLGINHNSQLLPGLNWNEFVKFGEDEVAYYYAVVDRTDGLALSQVRFPYGAIQTQFQDICLIPHDVASSIYFSSWARRSQTPFKELQQGALQLLFDHANSGFKPHALRKKIGSHAWQNLETRLIKYLIFGDDSRVTPVHRLIKEDLYRFVPGMDTLVPIVYEIGNYHHRIYGLVKPQHAKLFDDLTSQFKSRLALTTQVQERRLESIDSVCELAPYGNRLSYFFANGGLVDLGLHSQLGLSDERALEYEALANWNAA